MAFDLRVNNTSGVAVIDQPAGVIATSENFISLYDYAIQYQPELVPSLHYQNGLGKITDFLKFNSTEDSYASDQVEHMEIGRLHNILKNVAVTGSTFTSPTPHNLRVNDVIMISDGVKNAQAIVTSITSLTVFVVTNDALGAFGFAGNVTVSADFSSRFQKGTDPFAKGKNWNPTPFYNYSQIIKETYEISESNMAHKSWVMTPFGARWFNMEMERTGTLFDNKAELTAMLHNRVTAGSASAIAGSPLGMKGVVQQIEERGNISNDYITTVQDLSDIALRIKQQGSCRELTLWCDHAQMAAFRVLCAGVNASFVNGANYGMFNNSMDMALKLDFSSILVDGVTFHFTPWRLLDDPTLLGATNFAVTAPAFIGIPTGTTDVYENGSTQSKPYLSMRYRRDGSVDRKRQVKIFGLGGTPQKQDSMTANFLSEMTNQVIGANSFFLGRKGAAYYTI
jgi:hypothetical protein